MHGKVGSKPIPPKPYRHRNWPQRKEAIDEFKKKLNTRIRPLEK